jgi:L-alanine-DL-glutamate epimerase-like enolase superfamily enzyme
MEKMKITGVETYPVSMRVNPELAIVGAIGEHRVSDYVIAVIRTDEGACGLGEANGSPQWSGESQAGMLAAINNRLAPVLLGRDPLEASALLDEIDRVLVGNPFSKAAIEMALLDLAGKGLKVPVHTLLGGIRRPPEIPLRFSVGAFPPSDAARIAEKAAAMGLRAVKVKVGLEVAQDLERVRAVRAALGEKFVIGVDANAGWAEREAVAAIPGLDRLGVNVIEQPLRRGDFRGCARLRRRTRIPIMLDESVFTREDALEAIRLDACDLISVYPGKNGGIRRSLEIAQMVAAAGLECTIGSNLEWEIGSAAMLHLAVAIPNLSRAVFHDVIGPLYYTRRIGTELSVTNGCARLPSGIGLGVDLDHSVLLKSG